MVREQIIKPLKADNFYHKLQIKKALSKCYKPDLDIDTFIHNFENELNINYSIEELGITK